MTNPLGKRVPFPTQFDPSVLCALPRRNSPSSLQSKLLGHDIWNCYEMCWCDAQGLPQVGIAQLEIGCQTPHLIESKSLKLFLGSMYNEKFETVGAVEQTIWKHMAEALDSKEVTVKIFSSDQWKKFIPQEPRGGCIDSTSEIGQQKDNSTEILHSNLLRSLCPVTGQPDLATVEIAYTGKQIPPLSLRKIFLSFRDHQSFHEGICEEITELILNEFGCKELCILCSFTRRGGIDINPMRYLPGSTPLLYQRLIRQ